MLKINNKKTGDKSIHLIIGDTKHHYMSDKGNDDILTCATLKFYITSLYQRVTAVIHPRFRNNCAKFHPNPI